MINGFFHTIQTDIADLAQAFKQSDRPRTQTQNELISMAALRVFATLIMGAGALTAISAVSILATAPVSAVLTAAMGAGIYAVGHDIFIMARRNTQEIRNPLNLVETGVKGLLEEAKNLWNGNNKPVGEGFHAARTEGTFFQPLWIKVLS